jgi:hypothetical protein
MMGIDHTAMPLEQVNKGMSMGEKKEAIRHNLSIITALGGRGISGDAKIVAELPPAPRFGPEGEPKENEYDAATWTAKYVKPDKVRTTRRNGDVSDSILPPRYILGCVDFKNEKFIKNSQFNPEGSSPKRGSMWKKFGRKK